MPQINATFPENLINEIKKVSVKEKQSFSMTITELVKLGISVYQKQQNNSPINANKKMNSHDKKHLMYSWTTLNLVIEVLKKLNNETSLYSNKNVDYIATAIKNKAAAQLEND